MAAVLRELRDPAGLVLALLTGAANLAIGVRPALAAGAAVAVLAVRLVAGLIWPQPTPSVIPTSVEHVAGVTPAVTKRELEIAAFVTDGLSNREIATRLFLP